MSVYGYVRVSTREQNEDRQLIAMKQVHVPNKNIYLDKQSGKDFERPMYKRLVRRLKKDDLVYIKSIDRLGRNYKDVVEQWQYLTHSKQVDIVVIDMPLLDTRRGKDFERPMYRKMIGRLKKDDLIYIKSIDRLGRNYVDVVDQWQYLTRVKKVDIVVLEMPLLDTRRGKDLMGTFLSDIVLQVLSFVAENERANIKSRQREGIEAAKKRVVVFGRPPVAVPDDFDEICRRWSEGEINAEEAAKICGFSRATFYNKVSRKIKN